MNKIIFPHLVALCLLYFSCCSPSNQGVPVVVEKSHPVSITGVVTHINRMDVDKSGKNPRFMLHFTVKIESYDSGGWDIILGPEIKCVMRESDLFKQTGEHITTGTRVLITAHTSEEKPEVISVYNLKFLNNR